MTPGTMWFVSAISPGCCRGSGFGDLGQPQRRDRVDAVRISILGSAAGFVAMAPSSNAAAWPVGIH